MTCPDSIEIELLHDLDILDHVRLRDHISLVWIEFMSVDSFDKDRLTVHKKLTVLDAYIPESDLYLRRLGLTFLVERCHLEGIQVRSLGSPCIHISHAESRVHTRKSPVRTFFSYCHSLGCHLSSASILDCKGN